MTEIPERCIDKHRKIEFEVREQKSVIVFENPNEREVHQIMVDGCVFVDADGERCDWLLIVKGEKLSVFVELKGSDIDKAFRQIATSHTNLSDHLTPHLIWIVIYSGSPRFNTTIQNLILIARSRYGARLIVRSSPHRHSLVATQRS